MRKSGTDTLTPSGLIEGYRNKEKNKHNLFNDYE